MVHIQNRLVIIPSPLGTMEPQHAQHHPPGGSFPHYNLSPQLHELAYTEDASVVPFGRSRNRRTVKQLDFLLDDITDRYPSLTDAEFMLRQQEKEAQAGLEWGDSGGSPERFDPDNVEHMNMRDHYGMQQVLNNVQRSQKMHEMNAPRLIARTQG